MNAKKCDVCGKFFLPYHDSDYGKVFNVGSLFRLGG